DTFHRRCRQTTAWTESAVDSHHSGNSRHRRGRLRLAGVKPSEHAEKKHPYGNANGVRDHGSDPSDGFVWKNATGVSQYGYRHKKSKWRVWSSEPDSDFVRTPNSASCCTHGEA